MVQYAVFGRDRRVCGRAMSERYRRVTACVLETCLSSVAEVKMDVTDFNVSIDFSW